MKIVLSKIKRNMTKYRTLSILLPYILFTALINPQSVLAHFGQAGSTSGSVTDCTNCHTLEAGGTFYVAVDGTDVTVPLSVNATPGQTLEVDFYFTGARGASDTTIGAQVNFSGAGWSPVAGTANSPTISGPGWDATWDAMSGGTPLLFTGNAGFSVFYDGTAYDQGNRDVADDDGTEPDGTADLHGTDFRFTVPAAASGPYNILLVGVGHTGNARTSKSVTLTVNVSGGDSTKPTVDSFTATTPVTTNVNIPITAFTASDNVGVTGYMITESSTPPGAGDAGWTPGAPATFTSSAGDATKTLYPWAKDAAGNVSLVYGTPASVVVDGTGPTDGTLTVIPADTVNGLSWTAAVDAGVGLRTGTIYDVRFLTGGTPPTCATGTSIYTGDNLTYNHTSLTNGTQYSYRVCAYDNLNNVSTGATGSGTPAAGGDSTRPTVDSFTATTPVTTNVNIPITAFTASDNVGVTGYMITESSTPPGAGDAGWTPGAPATFTSSAGDATKTLYPWAKDAAGNVSLVYGTPASVVVDGTGPTDGTLTVIPADTVNGLSWTAAVDAGVGLRTGTIYDVRFLTGGTPPTCATGTSIYTGDNLTYNHTSLTNGTQYSYRVCAYDNLNNVSTGATGSGTPAALTVPPLSATTVYWIQVGRQSSVKDTTAKLGATINSQGGSAITERGVVWSTTDNTPTIGEPGVTKIAEGGTATGVFSANITALTNASLIYFSGYATNLQGTGYSPVSTFYTEPDAAPAPTVDAPTGTNYFDLTVNYTKPANADGVLVVVRPSYAPNTLPYDGLAYTANSRIGGGDTIDPGCIVFCNYVVADDTASGSVTVTGLKDNLNHYFAVYAYKGSGAGITGINYVQTINATGPVITDTVPAAGKSHNELYVAQGGAGGTMTSADCANCHGVHHTAQLLPNGIDMYNKCFACHQAGGAADPKINIGMHLADGSVDCGTCHSMHSFREEELYSTDHLGTKGFNLSFVRANMQKYFNTANGFPVNALEPTVFQNDPADFAFQSTDPPYNAVCQTCHSDDARTSHHQQDATDDHQFGNDCITCHSHKNTDEYNAFKASSHPVDFGKDAACTVCHDPAGTKSVLNDIHGNGTIATCTLCHAGSPTRNNEKLGANGLGDARNADGTAAAGTWASQTCLTCHDVTDPDINPPIATVGEMHHGHTDATSGNCVACHMPNVGAQSPLTNRSDIMMPTNLACNFCHLWWPNNTDYINQGTDNGYDATTVAGKVMIYRLTFDPVTNQRMMATIAPLTSHAISTNAVTPINDYGACLACHGATGVDNGRIDAVGQADMMRPFHGLGQPVTAAVAVNASGSNADFNRHVNNFFAGPQQTTSSAPVKTVPYNPGYAAFNFLALDVGTNQGGGTKPYATDDNTYKFIHTSERSIRGIACRNTTIGSTTTSIEYNNWGGDLGAVGNITVNTGGVEGATNKNTVLPLTNISLPTNIGPQPGCP